MSHRPSAIHKRALQKKTLSQQEALQKLRHYCAYQERCHKEVREKLYGYGLHKPDVEEAISVLIGEDYLNEERYALAFAGGHFRSKQWGKAKIGYELKVKGVSEYCIRKALKAIDEDDYFRTIQSLVRKKRRELEGKGLRDHQLKYKISQYMMQRGFEQSLVQEALRDLSGDD
jgi:regulatory protein